MKIGGGGMAAGTQAKAQLESFIEILQQVGTHHKTTLHVARLRNHIIDLGPYRLQICHQFVAAFNGHVSVIAPMVDMDGACGYPIIWNSEFGRALP